MNKETYKREDINAYLLGALPEAEAEYFDELSFTDDDFADELSAAEKDLVDAYVNDELKGENLEKFKDHYLSSPLRREKVEFAKSFQNFAGKDLARAAPVVVEEKKKSFWADLLTIPRLHAFGFALATLALVLFGGWVLWENSRLNSELGKIQKNNNQQNQPELKEPEKPLPDEPANQSNTNSEIKKDQLPIPNRQSEPKQESKKQPEKQPKTVEQKRPLEQPAPTPKVLPSPTRQPAESEVAQAPKPPKRDGEVTLVMMLLPPLRSGNKLATFSVKPGMREAKTTLQLESDDYPSYQVKLLSQSDNQTLWQSKKIVSKADKKNKEIKIIKVSFPTKLLKSQVYSLQVSGVKPDGSTEIIGDYPFKIVQ